ncbi:MAG TPA: 3-phosphoserine/phosphohydroxythreonine transaminase [Candidatus Hydrogenedentes bacterium]|nr:3-phosphoserine/phosphohydroxythreonine transaminase [Candidatus Hydrogenedentota bacterium]
MEQRIFNFSAGPAVLPLPVLQRAREELVSYPGAGMSVMEMSHRSKAFAAIHEAAKANIKALLGLPDHYRVLFIAGGATMQFIMLAMNFLGKDKSADYVQCGSWASKAMSEAKRFGAVRAVWSGKDENYVRMPANEELDLDPNAAYVHFTSNETIQGIQTRTEPEVGETPLFCDASSDFFSRPIAADKYALLYAGAQKNAGPAGMAVVILREDLLELVPEGLPSLLDYRLMAENDSLYNTPPCYTIYITGLVARWLKDDVGGLEKMDAVNRAKAQLLYDAIDQSGGFYKGHARTDSRSLMNVTFTLPEPDLEARFVTEAKAAGMDGLKGHRSVGGCRASIYNAMPAAGCEALRDFMIEFQRKNG